MRSIWSFGLAGLALVAVSSCGGGSGASAEPETTTTVASTTTTIPATTTTAPPTPAEKYLEFVTPLNCTGALFNLEYESISSGGGFYSNQWEAIQQRLLPGYGNFANAELAFVSNLALYEWPENVQADVDQLMAELTSDAALHLELSRLPDWASFAKWDRYDEFSPNQIASIVRAKIGLESNLTTDMDYCKEVFG